MLFISLLAVSLTSCYDGYKNDNEEIYIGFSMQRPLVPLVETSDDVLSLDAGVVVSGKYYQNEEWRVNYQIDESLLSNSAVLSDPTLEEQYKGAFEVLPEEYYTVSNGNQIVIPEGDILGRVNFSIDKEKFMSDPKALAGKYVLPLSVTKCNEPAEILDEKSFAVIALTYVNQYHGEYWLIGKDVREDGNEVIYSESEDELVKNKIASLVTSGQNTLSIDYVGRFDSAGNTMKMTVNSNNSVVLSTLEGSNISDLSGSGTYDPDTNRFTLTYTYVDSEGLSHAVTDTLIFIKVLNDDQRVVDWEGVLVK